GTAGLLRIFVSGYSRVPRPPPRIRQSTSSMESLAGSPGRRSHVITPAWCGEKRGSPPPMDFAVLSGRLHSLYHPFGQQPGLLHAVGQGYAAVGVATEEQPTMACDSGLDPRDTVEVSDEVLRNGPVPPDDLGEPRRGSDAEDAGQLGVDSCSESRIVPINDVW